MRRVSVGIMGAGFIGSGLAHLVLDDPRFELAFVYARSRGQLTDLPAHLWADESTLVERASTTGLVVEAAHPSLTASYGTQFLTYADYLALSVSALVDDAERAKLLDAAVRNGHRLLLPHGALAGLESLLTAPAAWRDVAITFVKNPEHIENSDGSPLSAATHGPVFEGTARDIAERYPRNVNSMITLALATVGLDRCHTRLVAAPDADRAELLIDAHGVDGSSLSVRKTQPMHGVSGSEMVTSTFQSVVNAAGLAEPGLQYV